MTTTFKVQNIKCQGCANSIITELSNLQGIKDVVVKNENHMVTFKYENDTMLLEAKALLRNIGYPVVGEN